MMKTKEQVIAQSKVVAYLARQIMLVHEQTAEAYESVEMSSGLIDVVGRRTADAMEMLGNILNGMDANDDEDEWTYPIFEAAHATWPQTGEA